MNGLHIIHTITSNSNINEKLYDLTFRFIIDYTVKTKQKIIAPVKQMQCGNYGVDLTAGVIFAHADFSFTTDVNGNQIFTISSSQKVQQFKITTDGRLIDLMTNKEVDINTVEFTQLAGVQDQKSTSTITSLASCREYVGTMCGLMSGYGMAELCALAALAGGLPGLGCAIIYAAIATWGCSSAMDLFC
ncbi:hypothetical protein QNH46_09790 [Paenibacillus woosongensis]|uniref:Uncharacterized protein n=1 Tax=Paenibacillus woosongensis TaxID=307580 RepID=A0AA95KV89_9BACL|nr:hypothetical protein [Paenibacillus woosongensis]WHX50903.1 hypothetical protein QNH46_09790 [Paenibacillus woosongensis]